MSRHASTSLASFIRSAELGSFAAAGKSMGISSAAVGQNIKRMEDAYGVKLFNRTTRKMSLTPEGALLFQRARGPLKELDEIDALFDESRGVVSGVLRITSPKRFAVQTLVPLIGEFRELHPEIEIDLDAADSVRDFVDDPVDIAFRIGEPGDSTMIARPISELPVYTMAAPAYLDERGTPTHPQDLDDHECIRYRFPGSGEVWNWAFDIDGEIKRFNPATRIMVNDPEVMCEAGLTGLGLIQLDGYYAREHVEAGTLVPVMVPFTASMFSLFLCYPSRENLPLRVRSFIDFAMQRMPRDCFAMRDMFTDLPDRR